VKVGAHLPRRDGAWLSVRRITLALVAADEDLHAIGDRERGNFSSRLGETLKAAPNEDFTQDVQVRSTPTAEHVGGGPLAHQGREHEPFRHSQKELRAVTVPNSFWE
jgi:hypothetical protein